MTQKIWRISTLRVFIGNRAEILQIFGSFLVQMKTFKFAFEINWPLAAPILALWLPCPSFPLFNHYFNKKLKFYIQLSNIYLGVGFEFGPQRIWDLAFVCPKFVDTTLPISWLHKIFLKVYYVMHRLTNIGICYVKYRTPLTQQFCNVLSRKSFKPQNWQITKWMKVRNKNKVKVRLF